MKIDKDEMGKLLCGAYDLHVHSSPDLLPRKVDDMEMAQRTIARGMAGFGIKSHYFCTAQRAELVHKAYPACEVIGSISLNSAVGGINPIAVEMAARAGAKIVWFPTCDAEWEQKTVFSEDNQSKKPFWVNIVLSLRQNGIIAPVINVLNDEGRLTDSTYDVLDVIAKHNMVLATGHISHDETFALVKAAKERGVDRIIITHVSFPSTFYSIEEQKELSRYGAVMEHCYTTYSTGKVDIEVMFQQIRALSPENVILGTDLGQMSRPYPDEGMLKFVADLYASGFSEKDIHKMAVQNSASLIH